jgi:predicted ATP-grasp superfamily ATP-dependent carboligase
MSPPPGPLALVLGDMDLVRALALAGIRSALFAPPHEPARLSRSVVARLPWHDHWRAPEEAADEVARFAAGCPEPPVLMPQSDGDLLFVSRHRERLSACCRLLLADAETVEDLVDKHRFARLSERLGLPTPPARAVDARERRVEELDLRLPVVVKPLLRDSGRWGLVEPHAKAVHVGSRDQLVALWRLLEQTGVGVLVQEAVEGPESAIESYHAYVDSGGRFVAGFTGRKIRTWPLRYGHSTSVVTTDAADVARQGREVLERLALRGVAKVDFKRDREGVLHLLEVNPRFTLWHHPAAVAGQNIPALVVADLTGRPRPGFGAARPGVRWCLPHADLRAARAEGVRVRAWLAFLRSCEARSGLAADDPLPFFPGAVWRRVARRVGRP